MLLPCPFGCEHPEDISVKHDDRPPETRESFVVECGCCLAMGPWASTRQRAEKLWNSRGGSKETSIG